MCGGGGEDQGMAADLTPLWLQWFSSDRRFGSKGLAGEEAVEGDDDQRRLRAIAAGVLRQPLFAAGPSGRAGGGDGAHGGGELFG